MSAFFHAIFVKRLCEPKGVVCHPPVENHCSRTSYMNLKFPENIAQGH